MTSPDLIGAISLYDFVTPSLDKLKIICIIEDFNLDYALVQNRLIHCGCICFCAHQLWF